MSCLILWSPGCWPQPIQRKEWDSGIFENLRGEPLSPLQFSSNGISQQRLWEALWQLISVGHLLMWTNISAIRGAMFPRDRQCEKSHPLLRRSQDYGKVNSRQINDVAVRTSLQACLLPSALFSPDGWQLLLFYLFYLYVSNVCTSWSEITLSEDNHSESFLMNFLEHNLLHILACMCVL